MFVKYCQIKYQNGRTESFHAMYDHINTYRSLLNGNKDMDDDQFELEDYEVFHMRIENNIS